MAHSLVLVNESGGLLNEPLVELSEESRIQGANRFEFLLLITKVKDVWPDALLLTFPQDSNLSYMLDKCTFPSGFHNYEGTKSAVSTSGSFARSRL